MAPVSAPVSASEFWEALYADHHDGWELGGPHPSLVDLVERTPPPRGRVAVPGCGRGHDARFLARHGYETVGFDFAKAAITEARRLARQAGVAVTFEQRDLFSLPTECAEAFDGIWEYTCFCAIDPGRRSEYVRAMAAILKPGGWFWACFFPIRASGGGPPFPVSQPEIRRRLARAFRIAWEGPPARPVAARAAQEWMVHAVKQRPA